MQKNFLSFVFVVSVLFLAACGGSSGMELMLSEPASASPPASASTITTESVPVGPAGAPTGGGAASDDHGFAWGDTLAWWDEEMYMMGADDFEPSAPPAPAAPAEGGSAPSPSAPDSAQGSVRVEIEIDLDLQPPPPPDIEPNLPDMDAYEHELPLELILQDELLDILPVLAVEPILIHSADIVIASYDFDNASGRLRDIAASRGGFVEQSNLFSRFYGNRIVNPETFEHEPIYLRVHTMTLRVPAHQFQETVIYIENLGHIVSSTQHGQNVTTEYNNTIFRLDSMRLEEDILVSQITDNLPLQERLALERRLSDLRSRINLYEMRLTRMDQLIRFSTIEVELQERQQLEDEDEENGLIVVEADYTEGFGQRFGSAISGSLTILQEILIFLAAVTIPLSLLAIVVLGVIVLYRKVSTRIARYNE